MRSETATAVRTWWAFCCSTIWKSGSTNTAANDSRGNFDWSRARRARKVLLLSDGRAGDEGIQRLNCPIGERQQWLRINADEENARHANHKCEATEPRN